MKSFILRIEGQVQDGSGRPISELSYEEFETLRETQDRGLILLKQGAKVEIYRLL